MKKVFILLLALFLISGCATKELVEPETACESPRIIYEGECCLDADNSGVCDIIEEALKRTEVITEEETAEVTEEKTPDQCIEMSSWVNCEDIDIAYDKVLETGKIKLQLKNNREGILVIRNFKFPTMPLCDKELSWSKDTTGMQIAESNKYVIECNALRNVDLLDTTIEIDVNYYERVKGTEAEQYLPEVKQTLKGKIRGST
ncbi:MAG: hypothetical protein Q8O03_04230 [Nanoarchaeota archaeon]|nr:hypothetical protein [Nanoarchaeota archaeon]